MPEIKKHYNFAIASDWEYDWDFINLLESLANKNNLSFFTVWQNNYKEIFNKIKANELLFDLYLDRASDTSTNFIELQHLLVKKGTIIFETIESLLWASDKATMHLEFISNNLYTPFTIILPPVNSMEKCYLSLEDLYRLGRSFIIKPANMSGGGIGVVDGAERLHDILTARQEFKFAKYLLQEKVIPQEIDNKRFWFRGLYTCGLVELLWWNDITHVYEILTCEDIAKYNLNGLYDIVNKIAKISKLNFFSTEIARNNLGQFILIDYVNPSCDMRKQSRHTDGVPDIIVEKVAERIIKFVHEKLGNGRLQ